jgi:UTP--glucose-1-phosphate uridylyltransferase
MYHRFLIESAVIPAAGYGSRMKPLTTVIPKEMFPLGSLPVIEHTVLELISSGIKRVCIVIRKNKEVIREYFHRRKALYKKVELRFVYQEAHLGLGDAIRKAKDFIRGTPFVMAIPDQILLSKRPATKQLLDACKNKKGIWNSMVRIPKNEMHFFEGSRPFKSRRQKRGFYFIEDISTDETSLIRGFGRTIFLPEALEYMTEEFINDQTGEVDFLKTFQALKNRFPLYGMVLEGRPCDIGTWEGYYFYQRIILDHLNLNKKLLWQSSSCVSLHKQDFY